MRAIGNTLCFSLYFLLMHFLTDKDRRWRLRSTADMQKIRVPPSATEICGFYHSINKAKCNPQTKANARTLLLGCAASCVLFLLEILSKVWTTQKLPSTKHGCIWFLDHVVNSAKESNDYWCQQDKHFNQNIHMHIGVIKSLLYW